MRAFALILLSCSLLVAAAVAQGNMDQPGAVSSYLRQSKFVQGECISLAKAIPQNKYSWRPEKGVRSISESFLHVALGNYIVLQTLGGKAPASFNMNTYQTSTTDKDKIVAEVESSFKAIDDFIGKMPHSDFDQKVKFFGMDMTKLDMIFVAATHAHETLGQAIAYARVNHIVPPWTAAQQAKSKGGNM
jgi:hypothetical protein